MTATAKMNGKQFDQLTVSQKQAVLHNKGPLLVIAGPGSGKTRVITQRIAALIDSGVKPFNICAVTFTNKAAKEMADRTYALCTSGSVQVSTFHSLCVRILRDYAQFASIKSNFSIFNSDDQSKCVKRAIKDCQLETSNFPPSKMLDAISSLKSSLISVQLFEEKADDFFSKTLARIYARYQDILCENNALDFDDLLMNTAVMLNENSEVCRQLAEKFQYLLIDEYQDTNHAQYRIAHAIASHHGNICVTGDPDQSIYRWRGADIENILAFEKDWPQANVVRLEENFRSTSDILKVADKVIAVNKKRKPKKLIPVKKTGGEITVMSFEDEVQEAQYIADKIKSLTEKGSCLNDIAVFYRVNSMSRPLEEVFIRNQIQYQIVRGVEFYRRKEIRDMIAYLRVLVNSEDEISLLRIINTPIRGIGKTTIMKVQAFAAANGLSFYDALKQVQQINDLSKAAKAKISVFVRMIECFKEKAAATVGPLMEDIFADSGLQGCLTTQTDGEAAVENIEALINAAHLYDKNSQSPSLTDYLQQTALFSDADAYDASAERVVLMTLHAAKGLEFENVFITGLEENLLPHERSLLSDDETEEERRLFFVGITRAMTNLYISLAKYRTYRGQLLRTIQSRFLHEAGLDIQQDQEEQSENDREILQDNIVVTTDPFAVNQLVRHKIFGMGRIKKYTNMGANSTVVVQFNSGQTKTLMVKYANLEKIG